MAKNTSWYIFFTSTGMKKFILLAAICIATQVIAQTPDSASSESQTKDLDYYMLKNNSVIHFLATGEAETVLNNASLQNGITITAVGEVVYQDGKKVQLKNGNCINAAGQQESCEKLNELVRAKLKNKDQK